MKKILTYSLYDLLRSRWSFVYFSFYLLTTFALLYFSHELSKSIISLMNIILILNPLVSMMFGVMFFYHSREFIELLLAQPLKRNDIFLGQFLGLTFTLSASFVLGVGIPFLVYGVYQSAEIFNFSLLLGLGVVLTFIFVALAYWIAIKHEDKIRGFGLALFLWLLMAVVYDGVILFSLVALKAFPLEKFAIGAMLFNPIDLSRVLIMLKLDISALMGYTGAVVHTFLGTMTGAILCIGSLLLWVMLPSWLFLKAGKKRDF